MKHQLTIIDNESDQVIEVMEFATLEEAQITYEDYEEADMDNGDYERYSYEIDGQPAGASYEYSEAEAEMLEKEIEEANLAELMEEVWPTREQRLRDLEEAFGTPEHTLEETWRRWGL